MTLLIKSTPLILWHDVIKKAESQCQVSLKGEIESYLCSLLMRYTNRPEVIKQIIATAFLEAMHHKDNQRNVTLQHIGDQCLLFTGLFPKIAEKRHVKISYFVHLGRSAYKAVSDGADDLFGSLALQFVALMDVLQSIRQYPDLMPLEAYDQWCEVGSQRALKILQEYTAGMHIYNKRY